MLGLDLSSSETRQTPGFFEALGSISSVLAFNRAARAIRVMGSAPPIISTQIFYLRLFCCRQVPRVSGEKTFRFQLVVTNFFDDFCQLELGLLQESAWKTAEMVMQLVAWTISSGERRGSLFQKRSRSWSGDQPAWH